MTVKPLFQTQKRPVAATTAKVGKQDRDGDADDVLSHSRHSAKKNKDYHAVVLGGDGRRAIDELNPTETIPAHKMYPGLANGE